VRSM